MERKYRRMVCLVGENPLPIYLGIQQFAEDDAEVILVHSKETEDAANAIEKKMGGSRKRIPHPKLNDPYDPKELAATMDRLKKIYPDAGLNYTGGTKVMSAFAVRSWGGDLANAFYLEEARGLFHFGDGSTMKLTASGLNTKDMGELHQVTKNDKEAWGPPATCVDVERIWNEYKGELPYPADAISYEKFKESDRQADWDKFLQVLTPETRNKWEAVPKPTSKTAFEKKVQASDSKVIGIYERMVKFAATTWMERLVECQVQRLCPNTEVISAWHFKIAGQQFESDGMVVRNNRLYYFSVTTDAGQGLCKGKLFEAAYRARQIGGGLARACVVCLADSNVCTACNASFNDQHFKMFGKNDVTDWMDGDTSTLEEFLNS